MSSEVTKSSSRLWKATGRTLTGLTPALESVLAGVVGLLVGALLMWIWGYDPWKAYMAMFRGAYGDSYGLASSAARGVPLILTALTFSICVRAGMFNIGAEGQLYMGALAAVTVGYFTLPPGLHIITGIIFAMIAGAVWSLVPAILKLTRGVHEVISTIMFNWIARFLAFYMVAFILVDPMRGEKTISIPMSARFPILVRGTDLSYSLFAAILFAVVIYFLLWHTTMGYEVRASGLNPAAARYGGIKSKRTMLMSFILGGLAAGLAGATVVMGNPPTYAVISGLPQLINVGFDGMAVAMVGRNHPIGIIIAALFFGGLTAGGRVMQFYGSNPVPLEMVRIVMGAIVLAMSIPELFRMFPAIKKQGAALFDLLRRLTNRGSKEEGSA
ncbi:MAG: ABC transporter permease [Candidatus Bipolaricaulota bacterium]|nr:ABC transporter permease [Candidatus Bipolaricaulota bacterium]